MLLTDYVLPALFDREPSPPIAGDAFNDVPPDYITRENEASYDDDDDDDVDDVDVGGYGVPQASAFRRKSVYDSRVEQILYENLDLPVLITDAGKNHESGGGFIVYTIRTGVCYKLAALLGNGNRTDVCFSINRIWKSDGVIQNSPPFDKHWSTYIPPLSFLRFQKNIRWRIMRPSRQRQRRIQLSLSSGSGC